MWYMAEFVIRLLSHIRSNVPKFSGKINDFSFFLPLLQKSINDLLVPMVTLVSTHPSTILIDQNLQTLMSTFTRLLDIRLDLFISYKEINDKIAKKFENKKKVITSLFTQKREFTIYLNIPQRS